ncbi:hypothetical protein RESH_02138 [Rhodopirellula europaea SH398]|uniref:Uncharacterized protein n=1 Tax=Rhodopirellula europaea SH398 TaxID=1263868 RepID=M5S6N4_9BACT|nr:hypothetical protein RESH_02138 [Rhodopirellula europaea SH398]
MTLLTKPVGATHDERWEVIFHRIEQADFIGPDCRLSLVSAQRRGWFYAIMCRPKVRPFLNCSRFI